MSGLVNHWRIRYSALLILVIALLSLPIPALMHGGWSGTHPHYYPPPSPDAGPPDSGLPAPPWSPIPIGGAVCTDWLVYTTDETGDWEVFRLGALDKYPNASANLSQGVKATDVAPTRSPDREYVAFSSDRDGNWEIYVAKVDNSDTRRVTYNTTAKESDPMWSPNGQYLAYESDRDGNWNLYVFDLLTGVETRVTENAANDVNAAWAPDSSKLAFTSDRDGAWQIYEVTLANKQETRLSDGQGNDLDPVYSYKGDKVSFRSYRQAGRSTLFIMNNDGSNVVRISDPRGESSAQSWYVDDSLIAYESDLDNDLDIYVYEVSTGKTRKVTQSAFSESGPTWLCNAPVVVFGSESTSGAKRNSDIFNTSALPMDAPEVSLPLNANQMTTSPGLDIYPEDAPNEENASREGDSLRIHPIPGTTAALLNNAAAASVGNYGDLASYSSSPKFMTPLDLQPIAAPDPGLPRPAWNSLSLGAATCSTWSVYTSNETGDWEVFRLGALDKYPNASPNLSQGVGATDQMPTRSPDGEYVAYSSDRDFNWEIYISKVDNSTTQRVTFNSIAKDINPVWSPNGLYVVYESDRDGNWNLYGFDVVSGTETQLTNDINNDINAAWSPDSSKVIYQSDRDGRWQLYVHDLVTHSETRWSDGLGDDNDAQFSYDGNHIVFRSYRNNARSVLYVANADGSNPQAITDGRGEALNQGYSPDNAFISYQSDVDGDQDIYVYEVSSGTTRQLTSNTTADYAPSWACGGSELLFNSNIMGNPDLFSAPAAPISAPPILVEREATQLTTRENIEVYPAGSPNNEEASREGNTPPLSPNAAFTGTTSGTANNVGLPNNPENGATITATNPKENIFIVSSTLSLAPGPVDSGLSRPTDWKPIPIGAATCANWFVYSSNMTGDWELYRLGALDKYPNASPNLSQGAGVTDFGATTSPDKEYIAFSSERDGNWEIYLSKVDNSDTRRVTFNSTAKDLDPAWSPTGQFVVYESDRDGNWNLYVLDVNSGAEIPVTNNAADEINAAWSPDGRSLVFQSNRGSKWQLFSLDLTTMQETRLSDGNGDDLDPLFSPDGSRIAFHSLRDGQASTVYVINRDGSNLLAISNPAGTALNQSWSPNSALLAYQSDLEGDQDVYVYEFSSNLTRIVTHNDVADYAPAWGCGANDLIFTSDVLGNPNLYTTAATPISDPAIQVQEFASRLTSDESADLYPLGGESEENASRESVLPPLQGEAATQPQAVATQPDATAVNNNPTRSPEGIPLVTNVIVTPADNSSGVNGTSARFFGTIDLTPTGVIDPGLPRPSWGAITSGAGECPDWLVYHTNMTGDWEVFRLGALTKYPNADPNLSQGRGANVIDMAPSRSPDKDWVAFTSNRDGNWELYVAKVDNSEIRRATFNNIAKDVDPMWSPDGRYLAFETDRDGNWELYLLDLQTGSEIRLTNSPGSDINPSWSPDGTQLVYQSNREGLWQIYVLNLTNGQDRKLSDGNGDDHDPAFSFAGDRVLFRSYRAGLKSAIYVVNSDGSNLQLVSDPRGEASNHTWYYDDSIFAYQSDLGGDLDIYVYDFASGKTRLVTDNAIPDYAPTWWCHQPIVVFTSDVLGDPNIFNTPALGIDDKPILVESTAQQMTFDPQADIYPENDPVEENASQEGNVPPKLN